MRNWFFDPINGRDTNDGLTESFPKQNLHPYRNQYAAGDTIILRGGNYGDGQGIYPLNNGTDVAPIKVTSYVGERAKFVGNGVYGVPLSLRSYWTVDNIDFAGVGSNFSCLMVGSNATIQNCDLQLGGIRVDGGNGNKVINNTASKIGGLGSASEGTGEFVFVFGGHDNEISNNKIASIGHAGITIQNSKDQLIKCYNNKVTGNVIDQRVINGLPGGGGGIYVSTGAYGNFVEDNIIHGVGNLPGLNANKAGIYFACKDNVARRNRVESYGLPGNQMHRALMIAGTNAMNNLWGTGNLFEDNFVGFGYGMPIYFGERGGTRETGSVVGGNTFLRTTITTPGEVITSSSFVGMFTAAAKYPIYLGCYSQGAWPTFANGNKFIDTHFVKADGTDENGADQNVRIGYYFVSGGWSKPISQALKDNPEVFTSVNVPAAAVATPPPVVNPPAVVPPATIKTADLVIPGESIVWTDKTDGKPYRFNLVGGVFVKAT